MLQAAGAIAGGIMGGIGGRKAQKAKNKLIEEMIKDPEARKYDETVEKKMDEGVRSRIEGMMGGGVAGAEEAHANRGGGGGGGRRGRGGGRGQQPAAPSQAEQWAHQGVNNMQGAANAAASRTGRDSFAGTNQYLDAAGQKLLNMNPFGVMGMMQDYLGGGGQSNPAPRPGGGSRPSGPAGDSNFESGEWTVGGGGRPVNQATGKPLWGPGSASEGGGAAAAGGKSNPYGVEYGGPESGSFQLREFQGGPEWQGVDSEGGKLQGGQYADNFSELMQRGMADPSDDPRFQKRMESIGQDSDREAALKMRALKSQQGQRATGIGALNQAMTNAESTRARMNAQNEFAMNQEQANRQLALQAGGQLQAADLAQMQNQSDLYKADLASATQRYGTDASLAGQVYGTQVGADSSAYGTDVNAATQRYGTDVGAWGQKYGADKSAEASAAASAASAGAAMNAARMQQETAMRQQDLSAMAGMMGYEGQMFNNLMGIGNTLETSNLQNAGMMGQMGQGIANVGLGFHQANQGLAGQQAMANAQRASANAAANASMYGSRLGFDANMAGILAGNTGTQTTQGTKAMADYYAAAAENYGDPTAAMLQGGMQGAMAGFGFSDKRLKTDIEYVGKNLAGVPLIKFRWKGSGKPDTGVLAQDVEKVHPDLVGELLGYKTVDYVELRKRAA